MNPTGKLRVLVVDDSAFARKVVREVLQRSRAIEVVGTAADGLEALEKITTLRPDVVTLDLVMPHLDGLGLLRALPPDGPRVVVVSITDADSDLGLAALQLGAVDVVQKPTALATDRLYDLGDELVTKVLVAGAARPPGRAAVPVPVRAPALRAGGGIIVVGASTGGPHALGQLFAALPGDLPVPVAVVLHIPPGYTEAFARRLDEASALHVVEASDGLEALPGTGIIARAGYHLRLRSVEDRTFCALDLEPSRSPHRPSVDALFESAAATYGARTIGVVLTGMGNDGLDGARAIREAGGVVLTESAASCVVYGMPRSVTEAGLSDAEVALADVPGEIVRRLERGG